MVRADINSFEVLHEYYVKDKNSAYFNGKLLQGVDPTTFKVLDANGNYAKDKNNVYFNGKLLQGADTSTFHLIKNSEPPFPDAKDKNNKYYNGKIAK